MPKARFDHKAIIAQVMEDGDWDGAIANIVNITKDDNAKKRRAVFDNIRAKILRNEKYKSEEGMEAIRQLANDSSVPTEDQIRLKQLFGKPLHFIRWTQLQKHFVSPEVHDKFSAINIVKDPFYHFDCPANIKAVVGSDLRKIADDNHNHQRKPKERYLFSQQEIDDMIKISTTMCSAQDMDFTKKCNALRLLECLCLLTGRRKWEVYCTLRIKSSPVSEFQAMVKGIGKNVNMAMESDEWYSIPLLAPLSVIVMGLNKVRQATLDFGKYTGYTKMFPKMSHTHFRDIYASQCYNNREINKFKMDSTCSKLEWMACALRVTRGSLCTNYATMLITDESVNHQPLVGGEGASSSSSGSPMDHQQDPV
jgi:hypothetical protein